MELTLVALLRKYRPKGVLLTGVGKTELLLPPHEALKLLTDLESLGVGVWGVDCYHYSDPTTRQGIVEEAGEDFTADEAMMTGDDAVSKSANAARTFIQDNLPQSTILVSLYLEQQYSTVDLFPDVPGTTRKE
jgi:hypothetical protein